MDLLQTLLERSAQVHSHLCPRQVLGVRMGMMVGELFGLELPQRDKRVFTFAESDGCGTGGISTATGCMVDRRTLRVMDYGKLAATFVDTLTGQAIRISPQLTCRDEAILASPDDEDSWHAQLNAYQVLPYRTLFKVQSVNLTISLEKIISKPGMKVCCAICGEEITNEREILKDDQYLCRSCAGDTYYSEIPRK